MSTAQFVVDAFTAQHFRGNPAAVCPLAAWPDDAVLQAIAMENNLSETAFFVPEAQGYRLRWFTPKTEVALCGHATLASAHVLYAHLGYAAAQICFHTRSGVLEVERVGAGCYRMDFPARIASACAVPDALAAALGARPVAVLETDVYLAVFDHADDIVAMSPDMAALMALDKRAVIVTAPGLDVDFVSRFFAPKMGVPEDPVTGSAHCVLTPYWSARLGKHALSARQLSARGGQIDCVCQGERVKLGGQAVTFMQGQLFLDALG